MKKPIEVFKNEKQLKECLKYWQKKLFLQGWIIVPKICAPEDFDNSGNLGENSFDMINKWLRDTDSCAEILRQQDYEILCREGFGA